MGVLSRDASTHRTYSIARRRLLELCLQCLGNDCGLLGPSDGEREGECQSAHRANSESIASLCLSLRVQMTEPTD